MQVIQEVARLGRKLRSPQHTHHIHARPFQIVPFLIAPVIPGETMKSLLLQARVVTDPIKNPLIGWWTEHYYFYVKHRDMPNSAQFQAMVLENRFPVEAVRGVDAKTYNYGGVDWVHQCYVPVVEHFFRGPNEKWDEKMIDGYAAASVLQDTYLDSLQDVARLQLTGNLAVDPDNQVDQPDNAMDRLRLQYDMLQSMQLTELTYEDWLRTYGVRPQLAEQQQRPELIRYSKSWTYPSNTVNPTDGSPSSACSWSVTERADKDRFFKEPGFIFGVSVTRPKVYLGRLIGAGAGMMNDALSWLPALLNQEGGVSLKAFRATAGDADGFPAVTGLQYGPLGKGSYAAYMVDVRDLLLYGDQYLNVMPSTDHVGYADARRDGAINAVSLPLPSDEPGVDAETGGVEDNFNKRYVSEADVDAVFKAGASNKVKQDGITILNILSSQRDHTATR